MKLLIQNHPLYNKLLEGKPLSSLNRHDTTQVLIKNEIARLIRRHARDGHDLLEIGGCHGYQTLIYRDQYATPNNTTIYDWKNFCAPEVLPQVRFEKVDLECENFPDEENTYDVVVCNQVFEHLKNIFTPLSEAWRVLRPGGHLILSVPNVAALHNGLLVLLGRQPTTLNIAGSHVRGYAVHSMTKFLLTDGHFSLTDLRGLGLHPFTSAPLPGPLRTWCHTPIWMLKKRESKKPLWADKRANQYTTTNFFTEAEQ